jgi:hypothetical protein
MNFMLEFSLGELSDCFTNIKLVTIKAIYSINDFGSHVFIDGVFEAEASSDR